MRTVIIAIIALIVGAAIGYFYEKNAADQLSAQIADFQAQIAQEMEKTKGATAQIEELKADIEAKAKEIADHVARITDLESRQSDTTQPAAEQPAAEQPAAQ